MLRKWIYIPPTFQNNLNHETQIIILIIPSGEGWHYLEVTKLWPLLKGITSKHNGDLKKWHKNIIYKNINIKKYVVIWIAVVLYCPLKSLRYKSLISDKNLTRHYLSFMQILCLWLRKIDAKIVLKIIHNKNRWTYSLKIINVNDMVPCR